VVPLIVQVCGEGFMGTMSAYDKALLATLIMLID
jgi:hypothetical protein